MKPLMALVLGLVSAIVPASGQLQSPLDELAIEITGPSREFFYTNKQSAHYYGETSKLNPSPWMGFTVYGHRFIDDYILLVNGEVLDRSTATVTVYPDYLTRTYPGGIVEQLRIEDSVAMFAVMVTSQTPIELGVVPLFSDALSADGFDIELSESMASIAHKVHMTRTDREDYPVWLSMFGKDFLPVREEHRPVHGYSPVYMVHVRSKTHIISFAVADNQETSERLAKGYLAHAASAFNRRRARMETLLRGSAVKTEDDRFDRALAWAKLSLDALIMNQVTHGIYAGLPWFNNYWGRDTFISLPGATLVQGRFAEAKKLLRSFAAFQMLDSTSTDYGRIPNIVTTTSKGYNTADGTPRFVMMAREYIERSGDGKFLLEIYPTVLRSIEGTIRYHTDASGFLVHGDAETWMDAVGPDGPWSPRGSRANDIQALWAQQLDAGVWFATRVGDAVSARSWHDRYMQLRRNFAEKYVVNGSVADRLTSDGKPDLTLRPNQIFTSSLLSDTMRARVIRTVTTKLTYPYGVASLSQDDSNFHPFHQYAPYYPKDAAYHNGTVWTWLQGPLISELCRFGWQNIAATLTANSVHQILDRGAVGAQSELLDAVPRPGESEPRISGTFCQAWNLAEFIRNFYDDYLGARVELLSHTIDISPHLPTAMNKVSARINIGGPSVDLEIQKDGELTILTLNAKELKEKLLATINIPTERHRLVTVRVNVLPRSKVRLDLNGEEVSVTSSGAKDAMVGHTVQGINTFASILSSLEFARPDVRKGLASLRGPSYQLLTNAEVKTVNPNARVVVDATAPIGDDRGTGAYTYPTNPNFAPGIFDLTGFRVASDSVNAYFTLSFHALIDPGWHPEYGFQLTYAAIAIDEDGIRGSGTVNVPMNARYALDSTHAYERLILVGGGVRVEDSAGKTLAAYMPVEGDAVHALGSTSTGTISFSIPLKYLGTPGPSWTFIVLSGAQDDHGGSGLGEFRNVDRVAGEWNGGGKQHAGEPNVYDVLVAPGR